MKSKLLSNKFVVLSLYFIISGSILAQDEKYYKGNLHTHSQTLTYSTFTGAVFFETPFSLKASIAK